MSELGGWDYGTQGGWRSADGHCCAWDRELALSEGMLKLLKRSDASACGQLNLSGKDNIEAMSAENYKCGGAEENECGEPEVVEVVREG